MGLKVAIQMDPIETIDIDADSTFVLAWRPAPGATGCGTTAPATWPLPVAR